MKKELIKDRLFEMMNRVNKITLNEDIIQGGLADDKSVNDFDQEQLKKGIEVEMEHTNDVNIAMEIAKDHLTENPNYYGDNGSNPDCCAQCNAASDVEKENHIIKHDDITDILLGFKPLNVGDYVK